MMCNEHFLLKNLGRYYLAFLLTAVNSYGNFPEHLIHSTDLDEKRN